MAALADMFDSICLCGTREVDEELGKVEPDKFMMVSMTFSVGDDFDGWFGAFEALEKRGFHGDLGVVKSYCGRYEESAGRIFKKIETYAHCVHVFRAERYDEVKKALDGSTAPYGEPLEQVYSNVVSDLDAKGLDHADVLVTMHHGVPDFVRWLEAYVADEKAGAFDGVDAAKTIIGEVMPGCAGAHLVYLLPKASEGNLAIDFDAEPYVGGDDLIRAGKVLRPLGSCKSELVFKQEA